MATAMVADGCRRGWAQRSTSPTRSKGPTLEQAIALNIAYALYVASGLAKSVVRLRVSMVVASIAFIVWAWISGTWIAIAWNVVFGAVHIFHLVKLWLRHRSIVLTESQSDVHRRLFSDLNVIDFYTLWSIGTSKVVEPGTELIVENQIQETVMLIIGGEVSVLRNGSEISRRGIDSLIGERSYLTGERANATVVALGEVTMHEWSQEKMKALAGLCPPAHESMARYIGRDLAEKLR